MRKFLRASIFAAAIAAAAPVFGSSIASVETQASGSPATIGTPGSDPAAVVQAILSAPGTVNGRTYSSYAILTNDGTGSLDLFGTLPAGYVPAVGDAVAATGSYSPFHQIPEIGTITSLSQVSTGNALAPITTATIPQMNQTTMPLGGPPVPGGSAIGEYLFNVNNVTLSSNPGSGGNTLTPGMTFPNTNLDFLMTDSSNNSMVFFYWPTSYSMVNADLFGQTVPTGPVNMTGFVSVFGTGASATPEFTPISITAVPEPATLGILAIGGAMLLGRKRRKI
jgi:hypothetical protein